MEAKSVSIKMLILNLTKVNLLKGHQTEFLYDGKKKVFSNGQRKTPSGKGENEKAPQLQAHMPSSPVKPSQVKVPSLQHKAGPVPPGLRTCRASVS